MTKKFESITIIEEFVYMEINMINYHGWSYIRSYMICDRWSDTMWQDKPKSLYKSEVNQVFLLLLAGKIV